MSEREVLLWSSGNRVTSTPAPQTKNQQPGSGVTLCVAIPLI